MSQLINISNEMYERLKAMKGKEDSFSIVIKKLIEKKEAGKKKKFMDFYGKGGIDERAIIELKKGWKKWTEKYA